MSLEPGDRPKLRNIEPIPVIVNGRQAIGLKDPLHLRDEIVCVSKEMLPILAMLDGRHSLRDIQLALTRQTGQFVFIDDLVRALGRLEEACLLEGERFRGAYAGKVADYRKGPCRVSSHAGISYSADPEGLRAELADYFTQDGGPGIPDFASDVRRPVGLIAPHIDLRAGGRCFARGYHALAAGRPSDVYVILGTGHAGVEGIFAATTLDFETPLGTVETDREFLAELSAEFGRDPAAEEILHATEHVIEFQVVFLQYLFSGRHKFTIVPILCSLSHHLFGGDPAFAGARETFDSFCRALKACCDGSSRSICFIASADLDHIGPRYGDRFIPHQGTISEALRNDTELLSTLERCDVNAFVRGVARENDERRICGFSPITTMLHTMDATKGQVLALDFATVDDKNSFVSFTSMIFH
jgi:MEMO1 family protein